MERAGGAITEGLAGWGDSISQRVLRLEQRRIPIDDGGEPPEPPSTKTWAIIVPELVVYPGWEPPLEVFVGTVVLRAVVAGTSDTDVDILVDGTSKATATLPASATRSSTSVGVVVPQGSVVAPEVTAIGASMERLTVELWMTP